MVALNRASAIGRADGAPAGLAALRPLIADGRLARYAPLHATHADLLERAGDADAACAAWERAARLAPNDAQRAELLRRMR